MEYGEVRLMNLLCTPAPLCDLQFSILHLLSSILYLPSSTLIPGGIQTAVAQLLRRPSTTMYRCAGESVGLDKPPAGSRLRAPRSSSRPCPRLPLETSRSSHY